MGWEDPSQLIFILHRLWEQSPTSAHFPRSFLHRSTQCKVTRGGVIDVLPSVAVEKIKVAVINMKYFIRTSSIELGQTATVRTPECVLSVNNISDLILDTSPLLTIHNNITVILYYTTISNFPFKK